MGSLFLLIAIILSILSRWFEYGEQSEIGDVIIFPAIFFLALAALFSFPFFKDWLRHPKTRWKAIRFALLSAIAVLSVQLFAWLLFWRGDWLGAWFLVPFAVCLFFALRIYQKK